MLPASLRKQKQTPPAFSALPSLLHCEHADSPSLGRLAASPQPTRSWTQQAPPFSCTSIPPRPSTRSFPPAYKTMWSHHLPSHRHTHTFILTLTCIPGFHSISVPFYGKTPLKWFISASRPPLPFSARSETTLFPNTRVNTCLFLPDLSRAHHALRKACSSLSFQVNSLWFLFYQGGVSFLSPSESIISSSWPLSTVAPRGTCS